MATAPTLPVLLAGQRPSAAYFAALNTYLEFLSDPPGACAYRDVGATVPNNTHLRLALDGEEYDRAAIHSSSAQHVMTIPVDGRWEVRAKLRFDTDAAGYRRVVVRLDSGGSITGGSFMGGDNRAAVDGAPTSLECVFTRVFSTGDELDMWAFQNSGGGLTLDTGVRKCSLEVRWLGTD